MPSPQQERLKNLLLALADSALDLASSGVALAHPHEGPASSLLIGPGLQDRAARVEALACAVLRYSGVSWDAMAGRYNVTRQSLHRRLSARADEVTDFAQKYADLYEVTVPENLTRLVHATERLAYHYERDLEQAPAVWEERRKTVGWWWTEGRR